MRPGDAAAAAAASSAAKSHKSAVCVVPPPELTAAVQRVRRDNDRGYARWPPHINLLYPFVQDGPGGSGGGPGPSPGGGGAFEEASRAAARALAGVPPFTVRLGSLSFFAHSRRSLTLWLKPDDPSGLLALQAALQAAFPECDDLSSDPARGISAFVPHLSLGQWRQREQLLADMQVYQAQGLSLEFEGFRDPFRARYAVPLGGGQCTELLRPQEPGGAALAAGQAAAAVPPQGVAAAAADVADCAECPRE